MRPLYHGWRIYRRTKKQRAHRYDRMGGDGRKRQFACLAAARAGYTPIRAGRTNKNRPTRAAVSYRPNQTTNPSTTATSVVAISSVRRL
jgi:hypothetical protein